MILPKELTTITPLSKTIAAILFILLPLLSFFFGMRYQRSISLPSTDNAAPIKPEEVACTMEAKICPDGTAVGRIPPNCEFAACPIIPQPTNWNSYINNNLGFWFRYPSKWTRQMVQTKQGMIESVEFIRENKPLYTLTFTLYKDSPLYGSTIEEYLQYYQKKMLDENGPAVTVGFQRKSYTNGIEGIQIVIGGVDVAKQFVFEKDGYLYVFHLAIMTMSPEEQRENEQILEQMISSFTFGNSTSDRKTYRNTEYGYTLDYPSDWILKEKPNVSFWSPDNKLGTGGIFVEGGSIGIFVTDYFSDQPVSEYYNKWSGETDFIILEHAPLQIGGVWGIRYTAQAPGTADGTMLGAMVTNDNKLYKVEAYYGKNDKAQIIEIFDKTVASFNFTN